MPLRDGFFSTATQTSCCNRIQRSNRVRLLVVSTHDFPDIQPSKAVCILEKPHESCPFAAPCGPRRKKNDRSSQTSALSQKLPGSRLWFSRKGVQPFPSSSMIEVPSAFAESGAYPPDRVLPGSPRQCSLPLPCRHTSRRAPDWSLK